MAGSVNDKFRKASGSTKPVVTSLALPKAAGATTAELTSVVGWNTGTGLDYVMYRRQLNPITNLFEEQIGTRVEGRAILTGTTLSNMTIDAGTEPSGGYAADGNTVVLAAATAQWADDLMDGLLVGHNQDGSHKNNSITTANITDANVTEAKLANDSVTTAKIANLNVTTAKLADTSVTTAKLADASVNSAKMLGVDIYSNGSAYSGSVPAPGTGQFYMQAGYSVPTTNVNGDFVVSFTTPFPNGLLSVVANDGDDAGNPTLSLVASGCSNAAFTGSSSKANSAIRVSYIAIGF